MSSEQDDISRSLGLGRRKSHKSGWVIAAVVAAVVGAGWVFLSASEEGGQLSYVTGQAVRADVQVTVSATGTVEPTDLVEISSELSGTIKTVSVDYNDAVEVGTQLAMLDTTKLEAEVEVMKASLDAAISGVAVAQATLDEARENYDRGLALQERGVESRQDLTTQKANFVRAQADFQAAIAQRELAQANLDLTQADLEKACICSPVAGVVLERDADVGQIVAASLSAPTLFTVAEDLTEMELQVDVDEADIGRVQVGQKATFTVEAYDDRVFPAEIKQVRFASETVDGVVTYKAILMLDNPDLALRPGMTATADITVADVSDALVVPNAALRYAPPATEEPSSSGGGSGLVGMIMPSPPGGSSNGSQRSDGKSVWVLKDGIATEVPVEVGDTDGSVTVILSGDLAEGDAVITDQTDAN